jgi:adenine-specific DNA-methyltransferase
LPIRYMGTKRQLAGTVRAIIDVTAPRGRVVDLFAGTGSVAAALAPRWRVTTNDALSFTALFGRSRFVAGEHVDVAATLERLRAAYIVARKALLPINEEQLRLERDAIGSQKALRKYMLNSPHVGTSSVCLDAARITAASAGVLHYRLVALYFAAGYFSLAQAVDLDAIRFAIDSQAQQHEIDRALGAWIWAASLVVNAPGHTAQYLKPNSKSSTTRVRACWRRNVWDAFTRAFADLRPHGTATWRASNHVAVGDALEFLLSDAAEDAKLVYADPPYTKDQYSRYYHVYETMYRYDFPDSHGIGRYRSDRFVTDFSKARCVEQSLETLAERVAEKKATLVLSYPSDGLLHRSGGDLHALLADNFNRVAVKSFATQHSTMGASSGNNVKLATENIYVCS